MKRFVWPALGVVLLIALVVGVFGGTGQPPTPQQRTAALAEQVRCPTCSGLSVADSETPGAASAYEEIERRVAAGESDEQILGYFVSRYGSQALLAPPARGIGALVWLLPVFGVMLAAVLAWFALQRWQRRATATRRPSAEDQALVDAALRNDR